MASKKPAATQPVWMDDVMIDLETLDTADTAAILSIGACRFNATEIDNDGFYRAITLQSNLDWQRTISPSTLTWWLDQTDKAKAVLSDPNAISLAQALVELREWIGTPLQQKNARVYGNGSDFDIAILRNAYTYNQQMTPWEFFNVRCFRTLKNEPKAKLVPKPDNLLAHNALFDAISQAQHLQAIWKVTRV